MSRPVNISNTVTYSPVAFDSVNSSYASTSTYYPIENGYDDSSSTNYAQFNLNTGSGATTYVYYNFNINDIPVGATINSVTCTAKVYISTTNSSRITTRQVRLYSGTTAKGSAYTFSNSTNAFTITAGSWSYAELQNAKIRAYVVRGSSNTTSNYYIRFYGATLTVNYSLSGTEYSVVATSQLSEVDVSPTSAWIISGNNVDIRIDAASLDDVLVTDNDVDVTSQLEQYNNTAQSSSDDFIPSSFDSVNSVYATTAGDSGNGVYSTNYINNGLTNHTSTTRCALYAVQGSYEESVMYYNFDCSSIPSDAIIDSVTCQFKGGSQGTSYYSSYIAQLTTGTTTKGSSVSVTGSNSSPSTVTINGGSSWTRAELNNIKIKFQVTRGTSNTTTDSTWSFFGATLTVDYHTEPENPYYWIYSLNNISADHVILIDQAGVFIPPEEDPTLTYWPITISSINAVTDPPSGTTRVVEGTNQTITITPSDPQLTLALDNGVDITSQLVGGIPNNTYTVTTQVSGASYGFPLNSSTGYYTSNNDGVSSSAAVCRVNFNFETDCLVTISYINYAEGTYDYGIFGDIDDALGTTSTADADAYYTCSSSGDNTSSVQTLTYNIPAGNHFIDIKYRKDNYTDSNNDDLRWKISDIEALSGGDYTYTLTNITQRHSLIFVFGDVVFYYVTSNGTDCKLFPDGQQVKLVGDRYTLNIVPIDISATVIITDNNIDVTNQLEMEEGYDKNNNYVVSYKYGLTNIGANHNLVITCQTASAMDVLYFKQGANSWKAATTVYVKTSSGWVEQHAINSIFNASTKYVKG